MRHRSLDPVAPGGTRTVRVVPVTHSQPNDRSSAVELPLAVKRHLDLDDHRSWIVIDELNEFAWPGFDLRPIPPSRDKFAYGFLPPRLFKSVMERIAEIWVAGQGRATPRD